jgi:hypothetical protein
MSDGNNDKAPEDKGGPDDAMDVVRSLVTSEMGTFVDQRLTKFFGQLQGELNVMLEGVTARLDAMGQRLEGYEQRQQQPGADTLSAINAAQEQMPPAAEAPAEAQPGAEGGVAGLVAKEALLSDPVGTILKLFDHGFGRFLEFKQMNDNPFRWFAALNERDPDMAGYLAGRYSGDPMERQIPSMLGNASTKAYDMGFKMGQQAVNRNGGGGPGPSPFPSESESGEEVPAGHPDELEVPFSRFT